MRLSNNELKPPTQQMETSTITHKNGQAKPEKSVEESLWIDSQLTQLDNALRYNYNKPLAEFGEIILTQICRITDSVRGAIFLVNQEEKKINALAGYACTPESMVKNSYEIGEGLIGQVVKNKEPLAYNDLYQSQVALQSSAGPVHAGAIIVSPLVFNDEVYGVIELLFLNDLEPKFKELINRLSANVAAMLQSIIINARTKELLELSTKQAEELKASDEEMRQYVEELETIQEEMEQRSLYFQNRLNALDGSAVGSIEFDLDGNIIDANNTFLKTMGYSLEEIKGEHHSMFVDKEYAKSKEYKKFWKKLAEGEFLRGEFIRFRKDGKPVYISGSYVPVLIGEKDEYRVWKLLTDITHIYNHLVDAGFEIDGFSRIHKPE